MGAALDGLMASSTGTEQSALPSIASHYSNRGCLPFQVALVDTASGALLYALSVPERGHVGFGEAVEKAAFAPSALFLTSTAIVFNTGATITGAGRWHRPPSRSMPRPWCSSEPS